MSYYPLPRHTPQPGTACPYAMGRYACWEGCRCAKIRAAMRSIPRDASMFKLTRSEQLVPR